MEITYSSNKLERQLTDATELNRNYGQLAKKIVQRLAELGSVENLAEMRTIPAAYCHELKENRAGEIAVKLSGNWRLIFIANHDPTPTKEDGGLDWASVTNITIISVEDYH